MKICYIANANSIHTQRWIEPLLGQEHDIHLISYTPVTTNLPGVTIIDLTRLTNVRKVRFLYWGWWLRRYFKRIQPDLVHAHQVQPSGWLGTLAGYHPLIVSGWGSDILLEPHKSMIRHFLIQRVLKNCDRLTVPSHLMYDAALALGFPKEQLALVPWGVETSIFKPHPDDRQATRLRLGLDVNAKLVLCPRGILKLYNHDVVIEAMVHCLSQVPNARLLFLRYNMNPTYLAHLMNRVTSLGLEQKVDWLPAQQTPAEMAQLYRAVDVMVSIPSSEGYGFSVFEAMATGCPTLISDLPIFQQELIDRVHTSKVAVRDVAQTQQKLIELLTNTSLRQTIRQKGLQLISEMNVTERVQQTLKIYNDVHPASYTPSARI